MHRPCRVQDWEEQMRPREGLGAVAGGQGASPSPVRATSVHAPVANSGDCVGDTDAVLVVEGVAEGVLEVDRVGALVGLVVGLALGGW
jgi:hypothetical protein